ncbi:MAG: lipid A biosynthesis acyltransferase, partial [Inhella sp.]
MKRLLSRGGAHLGIGLMWLLHWLPMPVLAALGRGLGAVLWRLAGSRRRIARRNLALCFPERSEAEREALGREHGGGEVSVILVRSWRL